MKTPKYHAKSSLIHPYQTSAAISPTTLDLSITQQDPSTTSQLPSPIGENTTKSSSSSITSTLPVPHAPNPSSVPGRLSTNCSHLEISQTPIVGIAYPRRNLERCRGQL